MSTPPPGQMGGWGVQLFLQKMLCEHVMAAMPDDYSNSFQMRRNFTATVLTEETPYVILCMDKKEYALI